MPPLCDSPCTELVDSVYELHAKVKPVDATMAAYIRFFFILFLKRKMPVSTGISI